MVGSVGDQDELEHDLDSMAHWETKWKMPFHPERCQSLHVNSSLTNVFAHDLLKFGKMSSSSGKKGATGDAVKPVTCILIGAGNRGYGYAYYAVVFPEEFKIVGVADPREFYRKRIQDENHLPDKFVFQDWKEAAERDKFADCVIIATPDRYHKDPAVAFAKKGYHILLEKPMAVTEEDCREIAAVCKSNDVLLTVCHVLRYLPWSSKVKEIIDSGAIGQVVNIQHTEPVGFWHFAHSYVRGNWRNESVSSNSLLAKCCHDVDLVKYWLEDAGKCVRVSSFGSLAHFRKEDKPEGAGSRCLDCSVESQCPYSAKRIYLDFVKQGHTGWPVDVVTEVPDIENVTEALKTGPYGRCVYECDNDVMSQQVTNFQFDSGATASLTMVAFTKRICSREVKIYGTKGEIRVDASQHRVEVFDFLTEQTSFEMCPPQSAPGRLGGHGGADYHLVKAFVHAVKTGEKDVIKTGADDTLASHLLVFAAEKARKENSVVHIQPDGSF